MQPTNLDAIFPIWRQVIGVVLVLAVIGVVYALGYYKYEWRIQQWVKGQTIDSYGGIISTVIVYAGIFSYALDIIPRELFLWILILSPAGFLTTLLLSFFMGAVFAKGKLPISIDIRKFDEGTRTPNMDVGIHTLAESIQILQPDTSDLKAETKFDDEPDTAFENRKAALEWFQSQDEVMYMRIPFFTGYHDKEVNKTLYGIVVKVRKEYASVQSLFFQRTLSEDISVRGASVSVLPYNGTLKAVARNPFTDELLCTSMDTKETVHNPQLAWEKNDVLVLDHVMSKPLDERLRRAHAYIEVLEDRVDDAEGLAFIREGFDAQYDALGWEKPRIPKSAWVVLFSVLLVVLALALAGLGMYYGFIPNPFAGGLIDVFGYG